MSKRRDLTDGNIKKQLLSLTWPMLFGMLGVVIFNLADTYYVGKLGVQELAAMSYTFPVVMFINSIAIGIGIGTSSLVARNIMKSEKKVIQQITARAMLLGIIIVTIFAGVGILSMRQIFMTMGAEGNILEYVSEYMLVWFLGMPFVVIPMTGNNVIRATGDTFFPGMIMVVSATINVVIDPFLIFGYGPIPALGIQGAALATVISRGVSLVVIFYVIRYKRQLLSFSLGTFDEIKTTWKNVIYIAGPAAVGMLVPPISLGFITKIVSSYGKEAVAAMGVASRIEMFVLMAVASLGSVMIIFVGQNMSRQKYDRIKQALKYGLYFSMIWGGLMFIVFLFKASEITKLFTQDAEVITLTSKYLMIVGASYGLQGLVMLSTSTFNGLNKPFPATLFSIIRMIVLYVPLAWIGSELFGLVGIFAAAFIANAVVGTISYFYLFKKVRLQQA